VSHHCHDKDTRFAFCAFVLRFFGCRYLGIISLDRHCLGAFLLLHVIGVRIRVLNVGGVRNFDLPAEL